MAAIGMLILAAMAAEQDVIVQDQDYPQTPLVQRVQPIEDGARVATSSVGQAGQRQTAAQLAPNTIPMARIANRIQNRVQSRIRNRIDRNYTPQSDPNGSFAVAEDQMHAGGSRR